MKTIVFVDGEKHSAWFSVTEAKKQIEVLKDNGYRKVGYQVIDHNYENGYYFV